MRQKSGKAYIDGYPHDPDMIAFVPKRGKRLTNIVNHMTGQITPAQFISAQRLFGFRVRSEKEKAGARKRSARYRKEHPVEVAEYLIEYYQFNREKILAYNAQWQKDNMPHILANQKRRREERLGITHPPMNEEEKEIAREMDKIEREWARDRKVANKHLTGPIPRGTMLTAVQQDD